jgi:DNA repair exonuclease SbcCD ATPase subunit
LVERKKEVFMATKLEEVRAKLAAAQGLRSDQNKQQSEVLKNLETLKLNYEAAVLARDPKKDKLYQQREKAKQELEELEMLLRQANDDVELLEAERDEAVRDEVRQRIEETESAMTANAAKVDALISELRTALDAIDKQRRELDSLDGQLGKDGARPYMKNIQRVVATNLKLESWGRADQKAFFGQPLATFLERQFELYGKVTTEADADAKQAS